MHRTFPLPLKASSAAIAIYRCVGGWRWNVTSVEKWFVVRLAAGPSLSAIVAGYRYKIENAACFVLPILVRGAAHDTAMLLTPVIHLRDYMWYL